MPINATDQTITQLIEENEIVLIDFWAEWCGPCKANESILEELAEEFREHILVTKMNVDLGQETASNFAIRSIPTFVLMKNGVELNRLTGFSTREQLLELIQQAL